MAEYFLAHYGQFVLLIIASSAAMCGIGYFGITRLAGSSAMPTLWTDPPNVSVHDLRSGIEDGIQLTEAVHAPADHLPIEEWNELDVKKPPY